MAAIFKRFIIQTLAHERPAREGVCYGFIHGCAMGLYMGTGVQWIIHDPQEGFIWRRHSLLSQGLALALALDQPSCQDAL